MYGRVAARVMADTDFDLPVAEHELAPAPLATAGEQLSPSPFHFRFTGEDRLQLETWNSVSGVRVALQGRVWDPATGIRPFGFEHVPNTDRSLASELLTFGTGYLLNLVVFASSGTPRVGQTFVSLHVVRGSTGAIYRLATIVQGYVTRSQELAFPGSPIHTSDDSGGVLRLVAGSDPAVGAEVSELVPTGARWQMLAFSVTLSTAPNVANRVPNLLFDDGISVFSYAPADRAIQDSRTETAYWAIGPRQAAPAIGTPPAFGLLPPEVVLTAGLRFRTLTTNLQAGDDYGVPVYLVREWLESA